MKLFQKPFLRSAAFRALLFCFTLIVALAALGCGIGTVYNIVIGSYGTTATVPFIDSPLADRMAREAVQNMSHELFNSLNDGYYDGAVHGVVSEPLITLTPSPMPIIESTPVPTPTPMPTKQVLYGTAPSVDAPTQTDPPIDSTESEATPVLVESTPTPRVIDPYPMEGELTEVPFDVTPVPNVIPADDSDYRLVLNDEKREYIRETMAAYLAEVDNPAFVFTLYDEYGNVIAVASKPEEGQLRKKDIWCLTAYIEQNGYGYYGWSSTYGAPFEDQLLWLQDSRQDAYSMPLMLTASLKTVLPANNIAARAEWLHYRMADAEAWLPWATLTLLVLAFLSFCLLLSAAGRRTEDMDFHRGFIDRLPMEIYLGGMGFLIGVSLWLIFAVSDNGGYIFGAMMVLCGTILLGIVTLVTCMGIAVRVKTKTFWKNSICAILWRFCSRLLHWLNDTAEAIGKNIRFLWKVIVIAAMYLLIGIMAISNNDGAIILWLFGSAIGVFLLCSCAIQLDRLRDGAKRMRAGNLATKVSTKGLYGSFRAHAEDLNGMADGLGHAVEERIKSERMKTDLITNVSHDLKTPLTSIVNYVELLKAEPIENETAKGYIEVLDRQAQRLKKLTVDIVDASKAQSGALNVTLASTDLAELLRQCAAEYEDRFAAVPLTPVLHAPETLFATADGRLLFRVLDNLLGNAVKYAMPNTRLYLDAYESGERVCISLKNISREELNIPADELTARFVRGDASRATEGSGLGLSIAEDLMRLMGGKLTLTIDGDLFRAVIVLPKS